MPFPNVAKSCSLVFLSDRAMGSILLEGTPKEVVWSDLDGEHGFFIGVLYRVQCINDY